MSWENVSGSFFLDFRNELQIAQSSVKETLVDDLDKWDFGKSKRFTVDFLRGFKSLIANIHVDKAWPIVKNNILNRVTYKIKEDIGGDDQRIDSKKTVFSNEKYLQVCLPVWMFTYKFNNKIYQISVNGQTGEIDGERPYSWIKITLFTLLVTAAIGTIFYLQNK